MEVGEIRVEGGDVRGNEGRRNESRGWGCEGK